MKPIFTQDLVDEMLPFQRIEDAARKALFDQINKDAASAILKTDAAELTEGEKFALAYHAGIPMQPRDMREGDPYKFTLTTIPCSFYHNGQKWIVASAAKDWPRRP